MKIKILDMSYYYAKFKYSSIYNSLELEFDLDIYNLNKIYIYER